MKNTTIKFTCYTLLTAAFTLPCQKSYADATIDLTDTDVRVNGSVITDPTFIVPVSVFNVGYDSDGKFTLDNEVLTNSINSLSSLSLFVGRESNAIGNMTVQGQGTNYTVGVATLIGNKDSAYGTLYVQNDATFTTGRLRLGQLNATSNGTLVIQRTDGVSTNTNFNTIGTIPNIVGGEGEGGIIISAESTFTTANPTHIATQATSDSVVVLSGSNATWNANGAVYIGGSDTLAGGTGAVSAAFGAEINFNSSVHIHTSGELLIAAGGTAHINNLTADPGGVLSLIDGTLYFESGSTDAIKNASGDLIVGFANEIHFQNSTSLNADFITVGNNLLSDASLHVEDNAALTANLALVIGDANSTGAVHIINGGTITSGASTSIGKAFLGSNEKVSTLNISHIGSSLTTAELNVGFTAQGLATIDTGGAATVNGATNLGKELDTVGTLIVTDNGSTFTSTTLEIGNLGQGTMELSNGAITTINGVTNIGNNTNTTGDLIISGANSIFNAENEIYIGKNGIGTIAINAGGKLVTNGTTFIGYTDIGAAADQFDNTITIDGTNSTLDTGSNFLNIGYDGNAKITITNGGQLISNSRFTIAKNANSNGILEIKNSRSHATIDSLYVAGDGDGRLIVSDSATLDANILIVSQYAGSQGKLKISDAGTIVNVDEEAILGGSGNTTITIENGGLLNTNKTDTATNTSIASQNGYTTDVEITGPNASLTSHGNLYIGGSATAIGGIATVDVINDGNLTAKQNLKLYNNSTLNLLGGSVNVNTLEFGNNTTFNFENSSLTFLGNHNFIDREILSTDTAKQTLYTGKHLAVNGSLNLAINLVLEGGTLSAGILTTNNNLDFQSGTLNITASNLNIGGSGAPLGNIVQLNNDQHLNVTQNINIQSNGRLILTGNQITANTFNNAGTIQGSGALIGNLQNNATGRIFAQVSSFINITGNSAINDGNINIYSSQISFAGDFTNNNNVNGHGIIDAIGTITNNGTFNLSGGATDIYGNIDITATGEINTSGNGNTTFYGNVSHFGTEIRTIEGSTTTFTSDVTGSGSFTGLGTVKFLGTYTPGASPALITLAGDIEMHESSNLIMELAGTTAGAQHDKLEVAGHLQIIGDLNIILIDAFQPFVGDTFDLFDFATSDINPASFNLPAIDPTLEWVTDDLATTGEISIIAAEILGDVNRDGNVDDLDTALVQANFGNGTNLGDADFDGDTDLNDLFAVRNNYGFSLTPPPATIPEPTSIALLTLATLATFKRKSN